MTLPNMRTLGAELSGSGEIQVSRRKNQSVILSFYDALLNLQDYSNAR
jgi:hypothetical protein